MKREKKSTMIAGLGLCAVLAAALSGCGSLPQAGAGQQDAGSTAAVGSILLSVNPEIEVAYDARGKVVEVEGVNDDGRSVVGGYDGYEGRDTGAVMGELVHEISDDGYFEGGINGRERNIVLKMADGSSAPSDDFMEQVADSVRTAASGCGLTSSAYALDRDDLDDSGLIGIEAAKEIVLGQLGIDPASASFRVRAGRRRVRARVRVRGRRVRLRGRRAHRQGARGGPRGQRRLGRPRPVGR